MFDFEKFLRDNTTEKIEAWSEAYLHGTLNEKLEARGRMTEAQYIELVYRRAVLKETKNDDDRTTD